MKAVKLKAEGNSSRLTFENVNIPSLNSNEILIRVYSVGLNTSEITRLSKIFSRNLDNFSSYVIGTDFAGIIVEMGSDVTLLKKGMHVFGSLPDMNIYDGALAQYVKVTENDIAQIPEEIDFSKAASVVSSGCAVCEAILNNLKLRSKEKILIHYAGTTLGYLAVQLASKIGAEIAVTVDSEDFDYMKALEVDLIINHERQDFSKIIRNYDAVLDTRGGEVLIKSMKVLRPGGRIVSVVTKPPQCLLDENQINGIYQKRIINHKALSTVSFMLDEKIFNPRKPKIAFFNDALIAIDNKINGCFNEKLVINLL